MTKERQMMNEKKEKVAMYYYIEKFGMIARGEANTLLNKYIFDRDKGWVEDDWSIVNDYLEGYDKSEDEDSAYGCGNTDITDQIEVIPEKKAKEIIKNGYKFRLGNDPKRWNP